MLRCLVNGLPLHSYPCAIIASTYYAILTLFAIKSWPVIGQVRLESAYKSHSLTKQPTFPNAIHWFPQEMTSEEREYKFLVMTRHYPELGSASDWSCPREIRSPSHYWIVTRHQCGTSTVFQTPFHGKPVVALGNVGCFLRLSVRVQANFKLLPNSVEQWFLIITREKPEDE